jgi:hypothetical protein
MAPGNPSPPSVSRCRGAVCPRNRTESDDIASAYCCFTNTEASSANRNARRATLPFSPISTLEVVPTGDVFADFETGRKYAEMTVAYARQIGSATFISFVLEAITLKEIPGWPHAWRGAE